MRALSLFLVLIFAFSVNSQTFAPLSTKVSGDGLKTSTAGVPSYFYLQLVDSSGGNYVDCTPSSSFDYSMKLGSESTTIGAYCTLGQITVTYTNKIAGTYTLTIRYLNDTIGASPYHPVCLPGPVYAPYSNATGQLDGGTVGVYYDFVITAVDRYHNLVQSCSTAWTINLTGASKTNGSVTGCTSSTAQYNAHYRATVEGGYSMTVGANNLYLPESPYRFDMNSSTLSPSQCRATGQGATTGSAGFTVSFTVLAVDEFNNRVETCEPLSDWTGYLMDSTGKYNTTTTDCTEGVYTFQYSVDVATTYTLYVFFKQTQGIATNGQSVSVTSASIINGAKSVASGPGLTSETAGVPSEVLIQPYDQYGNKITTCPGTYTQFSLDLTSQIDSSVTCSGEVVGCDSSTGQVNSQYTCFLSGPYTLVIAFQGTKISNSPFTPTITPGAISGPISIASGDGLSTAYAGAPAYVKIVAYDQYNNRNETCQTSPTFELTVESVQSGISVTGKVLNCTSGIYVCQYTITQIAVYRLKIQYLNNNVDDSPYPIQSFPGPPSASKCSTVGAGLSTATAGVYASFNTSCSDQFGNSITTCLSSSYWSVGLVGISPITAKVSGSYVSCSPTTNGTPSTTIFRYNATTAGAYSLTLGFDGQGTKQTIKTSTPVVKATTADPDHTAAYGQGVTSQSLTAGANTTLVIITQDRFGNNITDCKGVSQSNFLVTVTPTPKWTPVYLSCNNGQSVYQYGPTIAQVYSVSIAYLGNPIIGSPFSVRAVAGALYGPSIIASGSGLTSGIAGIPSPFQLTGKDQYGNLVTSCTTAITSFKVTLTGPATITGSVFSCSAGVYAGNYTALKVGNYSLDIDYFTTSISGSPFSPVISAGAPVDSRATASGNGVMEGSVLTAGKQASVVITTHDQYGNPTTDCSLTESKSPASSSYWTVSVVSNAATYAVTSTQCSKGVYTGSYTPTKVGNYKVTVSGRSSTISGTPTNVSVIASTFYPDNSISQEFNNQVIGSVVSFTITTYDQFRNRITSCPSFNNSDWSIVLNPTSSGYSSFNGAVTGCTGAGIINAKVTSYNATIFVVVITYKGSSISNSGFLTTFVYGTASAAYSKAYGNGVSASSSNIAGTNIQFMVQTYNQYGARIVSVEGCQFPASNWVVTITPAGFNVQHVDGQLKVIGCELGVWTFQYNATVSETLTVDIQLNGTDISNNPYSAVIFPGPIDISKTSVTYANNTGFLPDNGTFVLQTKDKYGNDLNYVTDDFRVDFSPSCANTTVFLLNNGTSEGQIQYGYQVAEGGAYCVIVYYQGSIIELPGQTEILISGGQMCSGLSHCSNNGLCFPETPGASNVTYQCDCFQGWVGDDCSVDFDSEYPLELGAWIGIVCGIGIILLIVGILIGCLVPKCYNSGSESQALLS